MKILVFGGGGFIGSKVLSLLAEKGHQVTNYDFTNSPNLDQKIKFIKSNISQINDNEKIFKGIDYVFHFAGVSSLDKSLYDPIKTVEYNILASVKIFNLCVKYRIKKIFFASTLYVNGDKGGFYKCSKQASEIYLKEFNKIYGLNYIILRFGSVYGRGSNNENGIHKIIENFLTTKKITYSGDIESMREYIHVNDIAFSCLKLLKSKIKNQIVNLSGIERIKVKDLLNILSEMLNYKGKIKFTKRRIVGHYTATSFALDDEYPKKLIPEFTVDFEQGLKDTIKYVKEINGFK